MINNYKTISKILNERIVFSDKINLLDVEFKALLKIQNEIAQEQENYLKKAKDQNLDVDMIIFSINIQIDSTLKNKIARKELLKGLITVTLEDQNGVATDKDDYFIKMWKIPVNQESLIA